MAKSRVALVLTGIGVAAAVFGLLAIIGGMGWAGGAAEAVAAVLFVGAVRIFRRR
jgi:hypothetical protein